MDTPKQAICDALRVRINQRPGLEPGKYIRHGMDTEGRKAYFSESRRIQRQRRDALTLLRAVELRDSISGDDLEAAFPRAFSGRLTCTVAPYQYSAADCPGNPCSTDCDHAGAPWAAALDYCTGQYWPTEYRAAAAAVLASALWDWMRDKCMPKGTLHHNSETGETLERYNGLRAGDWLRRAFRREFGRTMQERYFD